ncbi:MAG: type II secretion system protein GspN [Thermodesulfobacteriota bacterium]
MTPAKTRFLYVLYIVGVAVFFIYWLFPDDAVRNYLSLRLKSFNPDLNLTLVQARPTFPPGLKLEKMRISVNNLPIVEMNEFKLKPAFSSLFSPGRTFLFQGDLYGGTIAGRLDWGTEVPHRTVALNSTLSGIQVGGSAGLERLTRRKISGVLGGSVYFEIKNGQTGAGSAGLNVTDCKIEIPPSVYGREHLSFKNISADIAAAGKNIRIKTCTLRGDQMDGKVEGSVELKTPVNKSVLNLSGAFRPHHQFLADLRKRLPIFFLSGQRDDNNEFPVQFSGTIDSPLFSLN